LCIWGEKKTTMSKMAAQEYHYRSEGLPYYIELDYIQLEEDQIEVLTGLNHLCPLCFKLLSFRSMPNERQSHWYCRNCRTEWPVLDLIEAYNYNELKEENNGQRRERESDNGEPEESHI